MAKRAMLKDLVIDGDPFDTVLHRLYIDERLTMAAIGERFGVTASAILGQLRRLGVTTRPRGVGKDYRFRCPLRVAKIRKAMLGRVITPEWRAKISATRLERNYIRDKSGRWKGGRKCRSDGYIAVLMPGHHKASKDGYVMEHILVMERKLGRPLRPGETVHHINEVRDDNRPENLHLFETPNEHMRYHMNERWARKRGKRNSACGQVDSRS